MLPDIALRFRDGEPEERGVNEELYIKYGREGVGKGIQTAISAGRN